MAVLFAAALCIAFARGGDYECVLYDQYDDAYVAGGTDHAIL